MKIAIAYLVVVLIWSTTPLAISFSSEGIGGFNAAILRTWAATFVALMVALVWRLAIPLTRQAIKSYLAGCIGTFAGLMCIYWGAKHVESGLIALLFALSPLLSGLLHQWVFRVKVMTKMRLLGIAVSFTGLALVLASEARFAVTGVSGLIVILVAVCFFNISAITVKQVNAPITPISQTIGSLTVSSIACLILLLVGHEPLTQPIPNRAILATGYLAVFGSLIGFVLYFYLLKNLDVTRLALITLITPVLALLLGIFLNHETITLVQWGGSFLVLAGVFGYIRAPAQLEPSLVVSDEASPQDQQSSKLA